MRTLLYTTLALCLMASTALAQNSSSNANNSNANAKNSAGAAINQNFESPPGDQRIETTPGAYPPALDAGTNNCAISFSGGGSVTGFGISLGASVESKDCNDRNWIALMSSRGWDDVAQAYACLHNEEVAAAFEAAGYNCPQRKKRQSQQATNSGDVPGYCKNDGGFASEQTIRNNCPNSDEILN